MSPGPGRSHDVAGECDSLVAIAQSMPAVAERRRAVVGEWYEQLLELTQAPTLESPDGEKALEGLVSRLRQEWMATAHEHADVTYRSPLAGQAKVLPSRSTIAYPYERCLEESPLDVRLPAYRPVPAGWSARHLLFSSGMAALSGIMQMLPFVLGRPADAATLLVAAAYFETLDLVALGTHGCRAQIVGDDAAFTRASQATPPDVAFVEPIIYDPWLRPFDVATTTRRLACQQKPPVLIIDSTLVGPSLPMAGILDGARTLPLVVQASSGLKLDQAGLELANVGIVSLYAPESRQAELEATDAELRRIRRLNGTALTVDTVALLDIPFFLEPAAFYEYCTAVFNHNAQLARAVPVGALFETIAHPALDDRTLPWAQTPFVFFHLRDDSPAAYVELEALVIEEATVRRLTVERGGSFGFRGHRCEAIVLDGAARSGIFKVALGARPGPSVDGIIALIAQIATFPTVAAAREALTADRECGDLQAHAVRSLGA